MGLYMGSQRVNWLALTSHHKWVFFRLHNDQKEPYLTYSSVIPQQDDTRPFRALLGMMLASEFDIEVENSVILTGELPPAEKEQEEQEEEASPNHDDEGMSGSRKKAYRKKREKQPDASALLVSSMYLVV